MGYRRGGDEAIRREVVAGFKEGAMTQIHNHINHAAMCVADIATVTVATGVETKTGMPVVVPWATALVPLHM
jgi:hypothetical protein